MIYIHYYYDRESHTSPSNSHFENLFLYLLPSPWILYMENKENEGRHHRRSTERREIC
jgi:hypothetical protein